MKKYLIKLAYLGKHPCYAFKTVLARTPKEAVEILTNSVKRLRDRDNVEIRGVYEEVADMSKITVIVAETTKGCVHTENVEHTLHNLQKLVGGYIEVAHFPSLDERNILVLVNEEGVLEGLRLNDNFSPFFIAGWAVFVGTDGENFTSLTDDQIDYVYLWIGGLV